MGRIEKKRIHPISGDTIAQRKKQVRDLLKRIGWSVGQKQILQTNGTLSVSWNPPFVEQDFEKFERLAQYAAVIFVPESDHPQLASIEALFEREPGLYFALPVIKEYNAISNVSELASLLPWYCELMQKRRENREIPRSGVAFVQPQQEDLWGEEESEKITLDFSLNKNHMAPENAALKRAIIEYARLLLERLKQSPNKHLVTSVQDSPQRRIDIRWNAADQTFTVSISGSAYDPPIQSITRQSLMVPLYLASVPHGFVYQACPVDSWSEGPLLGL